MEGQIEGLSDWQVEELPGQSKAWLEGLSRQHKVDWRPGGLPDEGMDGSRGTSAPTQI